MSSSGNNNEYQQFSQNYNAAKQSCRHPWTRSRLTISQNNGTAFGRRHETTIAVRGLIHCRPGLF